MSLNATLFGQMITFGIFVWFTMRFVWPLLESALEQRSLSIAEGLAAAQKGHETLAEAKRLMQKQLQEVREKIGNMIEQANHEAEQIRQEARQAACREKDQILADAKAQVAQQVEVAREILQKDIAALALHSAEKILNRVITDSDQKNFLDNATGQLGGK